MRIALLIAASLLATACNERAGDADRVAEGAAPAQTETGSAFADQPPTALGFAKAVAMSDMYEVTAGRIALEKGQSEAVRSFAQMMVADHTKSAKAMEDSLGDVGDDYSMPATLDTEHQAQIDVLESLQGDAFDREYLSQQTAAHAKTLALLKSYAGNGDVPELRQFAQGAIPVVQKHKDWLDTNPLAPGAAATPR